MPWNNSGRPDPISITIGTPLTAVVRETTRGSETMFAVHHPECSDIVRREIRERGGRPYRIIVADATDVEAIVEAVQTRVYGPPEFRDGGELRAEHVTIYPCVR